MSVPNRLAVVEQVNTARPEFLRHNTPAACAEFLQHVRAAMPPAERWGFLTKSEGESGHTLPNGRRIALDVVALPDGNRVDIISGSNNHPLPAGPSWQVIPPEHWRPGNVYIDGSRWPIFDSGTHGGGQPANVAELGHGWFCLLRDFQDYAADIPPNAAFIREHLAPKVWRVFLDVEGLSHVQGSNPDPWRDAGIDGRASNWSDLFKKALDWAGEADEQLWCCVYGGRNHFPEAHSRRAFHDRIIQAAEGRWSAIYGLECMNEYRVNHWTEDEVRDAGIDLRSKVPVGTRLALSSPRYAHETIDGRDATNEEMAQCISGEPDAARGLEGGLYRGTGHAGASVMSVHLMRDSGSKWADLFSYNPFALELPLINGEPFGDGASAGGDVSDPALIAADYQRTCDAAWSLYVAHPASWCIWRNHLPPEYPKRLYRWVRDVPHIEETYRRLRAIHDGGTAPVPQPGDDMQAYPDETLIHQLGKDIQKAYDDAGKPFNAEAGVWFTRTMDDYYHGKKPLPEYVSPRIAELRKELGIPPA